MNRHAHNQPLLHLSNIFLESMQHSTYATSEPIALEVVDDICTKTMDQVVQNGLKSRVCPFTVRTVVM